MRNNNRRLWGQEFSLVRGGLDQDQVIKYVNDLITRYRAMANRKEHAHSLGMLSERAALEVSRIAADIKARAEREAEVEAGRIIAQANERAREILAQGERAAQKATEKEIENILQVARRKAVMIEAEGMQRAQMFLIRSKEAIDISMKEDTGVVYRRLIRSLQDFLTQAREIDGQWKGRAMRLGEGQTYGVERYEELEAVLSEELAKVSLPIGVEEESITLLKEEPVAAEPASAYEQARRRVSEAEAVASDQVVVAGEIEETRRSGQVEDGESEVAGREALRGEAKSEVVDLGEAVDMRVVEVVEEVVGLEHAGSRPAEIVDVDVQVVVNEEAEDTVGGLGTTPPKPVDTEGSKGDNLVESTNVVTSKSALSDRMAIMYEGEVDISLIPPMRLDVISEIQDRLQKISEAKILRTVGSWERGTIISIALEKPLPLVVLLSEIHAVEVVPNLSGKDGFLNKAVDVLSMGKTKEKGRARISLRMQQ